MSLFTQTSNALESVITEWSSLSDSIDEQIEVLADLHQQSDAIDGEVLSGLAEAAAPLAAQLQALDARLAPVLVAVAKFVAKANEGKADPEKALYGAGMVAKIETAAQRVAELEASYTPKKESFNSSYKQLLQKVSEAAAQAENQARENTARAQAEAARLAAEQQEAARVRAEEEKAAAAAAATKAKQEADAAAAAQVEAQRVAKEEADARANADRVAREQLLAERRAAEAAEAAARIHAAEEERKQKEAADSSKPLDQRCREQLAAAIAELKASCSPADLTIALQTLLKFVTNVMQQPMEDKFRSIRLNNAVFQTRLGQKAGGLACLRAIGFESIRTGDIVPAGSDLKPNEEYYKLEAKAELWPVLVASKKTLDEAMAENRIRDPPIGGAGIGAGAGFGAGAGAAASPFAGMFPPAGGAAPAAGAGFGGLPPNPMALLSDPFMQQLMSSPNMMNLAMQASQNGGAPTPQMQQALMGEMMANPQMLSSLMQSPLVQGMMSDPARMQQMMQMRQQMGGGGGMGMGGASPFGGMGGFPFGMPPAAAAAPAPAAAPAANPMAAWLNMMGGARGGAAGGVPPSPFQMFQPPAAAAAAAPPAAVIPAAAPAAVAAPPAAAAAAAAPPAEEEIDEEALLAEAIQMSMSTPSDSQPPEKKEQ